MLDNKCSLGNISIEPNYTDKWIYDSPENGDFIMLNEVVETIV